MPKSRETNLEPLLREKQRFETHEGRMVEDYSRFLDSYARYREMTGCMDSGRQETIRWRSNLVAKLER